jgi:hypothetical protein
LARVPVCRTRQHGVVVRKVFRSFFSGNSHESLQCTPRESGSACTGFRFRGRLEDGGPLALEEGELAHAGLLPFRRASRRARVMRSRKPPS